MFANRIAIITGGGSGIGRALAKIIATEGGSIVVADRSLNGANETVASLTKNSTSQHVAVEVNVASSDSVRSMFTTVNQTYGNDSVATILANFAGITRDAFVKKMSENDFDEVIDVNLKGTFLTTQLAVQKMLEAKVESGSILNVSSVSARIGNMGQANYAASKAAIEAFTKTVSRELGRHNIRCNCLVPGSIDTPMVKTVPEELMSMMLMVTPLGRLGTPTEAAEAAAFLLSDKSSYITGTSLMVSGGFAI